MLFYYAAVAAFYLSVTLAAPSPKQCVDGLCHPGQTCQTACKPYYCKLDSYAPKCYADGAKCISTSDCCNCNAGVQCHSGVCMKPPPPPPKYTTHPVTPPKYTTKPPPPKTTTKPPPHTTTTHPYEPPHVTTHTTSYVPPPVYTPPTPPPPKCVPDTGYCHKATDCCNSEATCLANVCVPPLPPLYGTYTPPPVTYTKPSYTTKPSYSPPPVETCVKDYGVCDKMSKCCNKAASCTGGICLAPLPMYGGPAGE